MTSASFIFRHLLAAAALLVVAAASGATQSSTAAAPTCRVTRIVDGDTVDCGGKRIRLLLIDAPERQQAPFGRRATATLARLMPVGSSVRVEFDLDRTDRYGRLLAYLFTGQGTFVNEAIVRQGFAVPLVYPPNVRYVERIRAAASAARAEGVGLWAVNGFDCLPVDKRKRRC